MANYLPKQEVDHINPVFHASLSPSLSHTASFHLSISLFHLSLPPTRPPYPFFPLSIALPPPSIAAPRVSDVRQFVVGARPAMAAREFVLMTTFPNKELMDESQTLREADLLNAVIVQRLK